jgi:hypothetical protein
LKIIFKQKVVTRKIKTMLSQIVDFNKYSSILIKHFFLMNIFFALKVVRNKRNVSISIFQLDANIFITNMVFVFSEVKNA